MQDQFTGGSTPTPEQVQEVLDHLAANPVKVPTLGQDEGWRFWDPYKQALRDERRRCVLREAETRLAHELMDEEEQQELLDRVKRLRRSLGVA